MFGGRGLGMGDLNQPLGVAVYSSDMVYVSEYGNQRISLFSSEGEFVETFGKKGENS
jgi:tripartite motif-containing protein 2/3/tripartite motif-containing protein 71